MKEILISWLISFALVFPLILITRPNKKKETPITEESETLESVDVLRIIRGAYNSLVSQNAGGYGPWLTTCIRKIQAGEAVPIGAVLIALKWTRDELRGLNVSHYYNLNEIGRAILALEVEMGEWG